jgi:hypothetical protein
MTGLTTGPLWYKDKFFQIDFNFHESAAELSDTGGVFRKINLEKVSVADFYQQISSALSDKGIDIRIYRVPNELVDPLPFDRDNVHCSFNPALVRDFHMALLHAQAALTIFRSGFNGKSSPVQFYWGSFDLSVSRFSGKTAPLHPGGIPNLPDRVTREAYSHEVFGCGFWPGNELFPSAGFYAYIYPEPDGFPQSHSLPEGSFYHNVLREFLLPYEVIQTAPDPLNKILDFLQTAYESAATLASWNRVELEKNEVSLSSV